MLAQVLEQAARVLGAGVAVVGLDVAGRVLLVLELVAAGEVEAGPRALRHRRRGRQRGGEPVGVRDRHEERAPAAHGVAGDVAAARVDREELDGRRPTPARRRRGPCRRTTTTSRGRAARRRRRRGGRRGRGTCRGSPRRRSAPCRRASAARAGAGLRLRLEAVRDVEAVGLEDPVLALLARDRLGRAEDALVVAGAGRVALGRALGQRAAGRRVVKNGSIVPACSASAWCLSNHSRTGSPVRKATLATFARPVPRRSGGRPRRRWPALVALDAGQPRLDALS